MASQEGPELYELARGQVAAIQWDANRKSGEVVAEITEKLVAAALDTAKGRQESRMAVRRACRGAMSGLIAAKREHRLPQTAVSLLQAMAGLADRFHFLPADMMTWCMEGIADITKLAGEESAASIQKYIRMEFMGTEGIFKEFCQKAAAKNWWTK